MNPLGFYVVPVSAPTEHDRQYHYLRRFIKRFPMGGDIAIFDRSWYGRVLVERVENYCSEPEWQRAYGEINEMEEDFVNSSGGGIVKFWLEITKEEQLRRFQQRANDPLKVYKITDEDWRNRAKWNEYEEAVEEALCFGWIDGQVTRLDIGRFRQRFFRLGRGRSAFKFWFAPHLWGRAHPIG